MPHDFCIHMMNRALEMCGLCERSERDFATQQWRDWNAKADELQAQLAEAQDQIIKNSERYTADRENWQAQMTGLTEALDNDPKVRGLEAALLEAQERIEEESKAYVNMMELRDVEIRKLSKMTNERDAALARVARLEGALRFYADVNNWFLEKTYTGASQICIRGNDRSDVDQGAEVYTCGGKRAREALSQSPSEATAKWLAMERVVDAAKGFRDHGEAKNGTHAGILFNALKALNSAFGEGEGA